MQKAKSSLHSLLPTIEHRHSDQSPWDEIPLGQGVNGEIAWKVADAPNMLVSGASGAGKSVLQRNIALHCIQHPDKWQFLGIDPKQVELSGYAKHDDAVLGIATNLSESVSVLQSANEQMVSRYTKMEQEGVSSFLDLSNPPPALMVMIDEIASLTLHSSNKDSDSQVGLNQVARTLLEALARLGQAAGVHLVVSTQRPDVKSVSDSFQDHFSLRYLVGHSKSSSSSSVLGTYSGTEIPSHIKGRGVISINGNEEFIQGYFTEH